jgi:gliding motility-associated-like protein
MTNSYYSKFLLFILFYFPFSAKAQLTVTPTLPAAALAAKLAGPGITISAPTLVCAAVANGTFTSVTTPIVIDSGIILSSGRAINTAGLETFLASSNNSMPGDPALTVLAGTGTFDACVLEFDFVPKGDTVSFNYQFGSEEYINSTCGQYNDAFAFFISGPGIVGSQNMALVPGTNIPVTVNSINSGVPGPPGFPGFCNIVNCTSMGPGSPFTTYYVNNTGGTQVTYRGYTRKLKAFHEVIPCSTYHLKIAVADASNSLYDSGVFIEAGSLKTNSYVFKRSDSIGHTIGGIPNSFVRGCAPASLTVINSRTTGTPQKVYFNYGGTAVQGTDFTAPDSAYILPGDTSVTITLTGILAPATGVKTVFVYLSSPFSCGVIDTLALNILDAPSANIITPDTSICLGTSFQIQVAGTSGLVYSWTPAATLSSATAMMPIASPVVNTVYTMTASLPLSGCAPIIRDINVIVNTAALTIITPDTSICIGANQQIMVSGTVGLAYTWTPAASLSNASVQNPIATPTTTTTYTVSAISTIGGCPAIPQSVTITVVNPIINVITKAATVCVDGFYAISVTGDPSYSYSWLPVAGLDNPATKDPIATPEVPTVYTVTATVPGLLCTTTGTFSVSIHPLVVADATPAKSVCLKQSIELSTSPQGNKYSYNWSGPAGFSSILQSPFIRNGYPVNEGIYSVTVTDNTTGCSGSDTTYITVGTDSLSLTDVTPSQTIKFGTSIQLYSANAVMYTWTPNDGTLNNPNINNPIATPTVMTTYTVMAVGNNGCIDTASVTIDVAHDDDIFIPSGFTPNGDGLNDVFRVSNSSFFRLVQMSVFNRWGELVYHTETGNNSTGWDGTFKGKIAETGSYNYLIILSKSDGKKQSYKGDLTLIR